MLSGENLLAQIDIEKGTVSYVSSQNVYVKFASTKSINIGDTLFVKKGAEFIPALHVNNKSSVSCVCSKFIADTIRVTDEIFAKTMREEPKQEEKVKDGSDKEKSSVSDKSKQQSVRKEDDAVVRKKTIQKIRARLSAASYSTLSDRGDRTRMRYAFSMQGNNIQNSKFSTDVYVTFRHTLNEWDAVKANLNDALKIYSLAVKYDIDESSSVTLGRKINAKISSLGAVDGIQYERGIGGSFLAGVIAGARPDMLDYSINTNLVQAGLYIGQVSGKNKRPQQSTLGIIEQRNKSAVDRRFIYFQHSNDLLKNLNFFSSGEMDLYEKINNETRNKLSLTNLFVSLRYRFSKKFNASISYDNRRNIIYYESYKSYIDQLIDNETRQGFRAGMNFHPLAFIMWGINASWRFQKDNANESKNVNSYLNFNRIPVIKASFSLTANYLKTSYINSRIYGVKLMKDIFKGKVNGEVYYRKVNYYYEYYGYSTKQNIVGASLSWQIMRPLSLYAFCEQTLDSQNNNYLMINTKIMYRF